MLPSEPPNKYDQVMTSGVLPEGVRGLLLRARWNDKTQNLDGFLYHDINVCIPDGTPVVLGPVLNLEGDIYETRLGKYLVEVIVND